MEDRIVRFAPFGEATQEAGTFGACLFLIWLVPTMALWAFAFVGAQPTSPDWLLRAQAACFGTDSSGLPSTQGWTILVLAPLSLFTAMLVAFDKDLRLGMAAMWGSKSSRFFSLLLLVAVAVECLWIGQRISAGVAIIRTSYAPKLDMSLPLTYPRGTNIVDSFELSDQFGNVQRLGTGMELPVIMSFAFAHCTTVCPAVVQEVNQAARIIGADKVRVLLVTLDPWRDTPSTLASLAKTWNLAPHVHLLSGKVEAVQNVLDKYIPRSRDEKNGDLTHPPLVLVITKQGELAYSFNNPPRAWLVEAVKRVS